MASWVGLHCETFSLLKIKTFVFVCAFEKDTAGTGLCPVAVVFQSGGLGTRVS